MQEVYFYDAGGHSGVLEPNLTRPGNFHVVSKDRYAELAKDPEGKLRSIFGRLVPVGPNLEYKAE